MLIVCWSPRIRAGTMWVEPKGGNFKPYTCIATQFIPVLQQNGFTTK